MEELFRSPFLNWWGATVGPFWAGRDERMKKKKNTVEGGEKMKLLAAVLLFGRASTSLCVSSIEI